MTSSSTANTMPGRHGLTRRRDRKWRRSTDASAFGKTSRSRSFKASTLLRRRLLTVGFKPRIDQRDLSIDCRIMQTSLRGNELHEFIGALDIGRAVLQRAGGGRRASQRLRRRGIFLERHHIVGLSPKLDAEVNDKIVNRARRLDVAPYRLLRGAHAVLGHAAIIAGKQH